VLLEENTPRLTCRRTQRLIRKNTKENNNVL